MRLYKIIGVCCKNIANIIRFNLAYIRDKFAGQTVRRADRRHSRGDISMDKNKIKRLCKIAEVIGYFVIVGVFLHAF